MKACIELLDSKNGTVLQKWEFDEGHRSISIGRARGCDVRLASKLVSREHARIFLESGSWILEVSGVNGCCLDGYFVEETLLRDGSTFAIGVSGPTLRFSVVEVPDNRPESDRLEVEAFRQRLIHQESKTLSGTACQDDRVKILSLDELFAEARETLYGDD